MRKLAFEAAQLPKPKPPPPRHHGHHRQGHEPSVTNGHRTTSPKLRTFFALAVPPQLTCGPRICFKTASICLQVSASSVSPFSS